MQTQSTTTRTPRILAALDGTPIPATVNQQTDMGWLPQPHPSTFA